MLNKIKNFVVAEEGQGLSEYGLLLAGIVVVVAAAVTILSDQLQTFFGDIAKKLHV